MQLRIPTAEAMEALAARLAAQCEPGTCLFLQGELGAGKTTFVRGFLRQAGYQGTVKSPTYTLVEPYEIAGKTFYHFDLYRINSDEELEGIGLRDYFDGRSICLVEWPERGGALLGKPDLLIRIQINGQAREAELQAHSPQGQELLDAVEGLKDTTN